MGKIYKVIVYVPATSADKIRDVLGTSGAGKTTSGKYDYASFSSRGVGRFRPLKGANPTIGVIDKMEEVEEERIETVVEEYYLKDVLEAVRKAHPYEEPGIDVIELKNI
jgi:hypothetical protein